MHAPISIRPATPTPAEAPPKGVSQGARPYAQETGMDLQTDYLVKGCGATAMAFVDVMLKETDAHVILVDRRAAPGGHWNDAYPFVRLHQPSACYGVASRALGHDRTDSTGFIVFSSTMFPSVLAGADWPRSREIHFRHAQPSGRHTPAS